MNLEAVQKRVFASVPQSYSKKDSILYALGLGYGRNPTDPAELQFTYENGLFDFLDPRVELGRVLPSLRMGK